MNSDEYCKHGVYIVTRRCEVCNVEELERKAALWDAAGEPAVALLKEFGQTAALDHWELYSDWRGYLLTPLEELLARAEEAV